MLTELFRLVIRGERNEGRSVEVAAHHLPYVIPQRIANGRVKAGHGGPKHNKPPIPPPARPFKGTPKRQAPKPSLTEDCLASSRMSVISVCDDRYVSDHYVSDGDENTNRHAQGIWIFGKSKANIDDGDPVKRSRSFASSLNVSRPGENYSTATLAHSGRKDSAASLNSSKHSLGDGRFMQVVDHEPVAGEAPGLSHTAARHKIAVRPRRTHALSRPRRPLQGTCSVLLPPTLEVNEELSSARANERLALTLTDDDEALARNRSRSESGSMQAAADFSSHPMLPGLQSEKPDSVIQSEKRDSVIQGEKRDTVKQQLSSHHHTTDALFSHKISNKSGFDPLNYHPDPHHVLMQMSVQEPRHLQEHSIVQEYRGSNDSAPQISSYGQRPAELVGSPAHLDQTGSDADHNDADKREETLIDRLFGSVRSGRRRSRNSGEIADVSRADSPSPLRREVKLRSSGEKTSESSKLPVVNRSNSRNKPLNFDKQELTEIDLGQEIALQSYPESKPQMESNQQQIHLKAKTNSTQSKKMETPRLEDGAEFDSRSCSVEGRLEGHKHESSFSVSQKPPITVPIASYVERRSPGRSEANVKKAKSFREIGNPVNIVKRDSSRRSWFGRDSSVEYETTRLSASYDNLDENFATNQSSVQIASPSVSSLVNREHRKRSVSKVVLSPAQSSALSSTDSLTTTEIPGVYIRPLSQYRQSRVESEETNESPSYFCTQQTHFNTFAESCTGDNLGGPHSLDSSITLIPKEEENIRKTSSSDHVSSHIIIQKSDLETYEHYRVSNSQPESAFMKRQITAGTSVTEITLSDQPEDIKNISVPGPTSVARSLSLRYADTGGPVGILNRRSSSADELEQPESKIFINRPRFDKRETSLSRTSSQDTEPPSVPEFMRIQLNRVENKSQRILYSSENTVSGAPTDETKIGRTKQSLDDPTELPEVQCEISTSQQNPSLCTPKHPHSRDNKENTPPVTAVGESSDDAVMLRPLRREKSLVIDPCVLPKKEEEPELYKVFARRSFKVRETFDSTLQDDEASQEDDSSDLVASLSTQMSGITKINPLYSTPTPPQTPLMSNSTGNKLGVGSPALSFKPPGPSARSTSPLASPTVTESLTGASDMFSSASEPSSLDSSIISSHTAKTVPMTAKTYSEKSEQMKPKTEPRIHSSDNSRLPKTDLSALSRDSTSRVSPTALSSSGKISIRPMSANRELGTGSSSSSFTSIIVGKALGGTVDPTSASLSPVTVPVTRPLSRPLSSGVLNVSGTIVTPVSWPPKAIVVGEPKKIEPNTSVSPEVINKFMIEKPVEIVGTGTTPPRPHDDSAKSSENIEDANLSQVKSVRLKFMNAGALNDAPANSCIASPTARTTPAGSSAVIEARNIAPGFSGPVHSNISPKPRHSSVHTTSRSHSSVGSVTNSPSSSHCHHRHSIGASYTPHPRQQIPTTYTLPSPPTPKRCFSSPAPDASLGDSQDVALSSIIVQNALTKQQVQDTTSTAFATPLPSSGGEGGDDWRALVRQRREDRLKQSKSVESLDESSEARSSGGSSRSSKVLEMANNFQKLQVA
ncbi:uncharacterized protein LOC108664411 isoform X2 [Hyalella azteca]|uniref:Uncharacterized protein LOC108664411 isoform X2 n=1 Tax=Hyalella azteca TaxID=294128 RepID=A0A979FF72_HYAAZ|nr:uncharacterized protein LOC108664411 isoform X2 [Hyalella azteca]